jgi:hypothetical protein
LTLSALIKPLNPMMPNDDIKLQMPNRVKIYENATAVLVMVGGVHAAQRIDQPSSWLERAWTLQEVLVNAKTYALVQWKLPSGRLYTYQRERPWKVERLDNFEVAILPFRNFFCHWQTAIQAQKWRERK